MNHLGGEDSGKTAEQEALAICLSTYTKNYTGIMSDLTIVELWTLLKPCPFQGRHGW